MTKIGVASPAQLDPFPVGRSARLVNAGAVNPPVFCITRSALLERRNTELYTW